MECCSSWKPKRWPCARCLARPVDELLASTAATLREVAATGRLDEQAMLLDTLLAGPTQLKFDAIARRHAGRLILELEQRNDDGEIDCASMPDRTLLFTNRLQQAQNAEAVYRVLVRE